MERHGKAELEINYPYLARSFDEEQLASFIREKHVIEGRMDACRQLPVNSEINLQHASESWRSYLRKPKLDPTVSALIDPYPFDPAERPTGEYESS
ncbi:hypothetical protein D3C72_1863650 [compost metagenome]